MKLLQKHGLEHLLGEIVAAQMIDQIEDPKTTQMVAEFVQKHGPTFHKMKRRKPKKPTVSV